jgi:hypothetical protein
MAYIGNDLLDWYELPGAVTVYQYTSQTDDLTTIKISGYFDPAAPPPNVANEIVVNDLIQINATDGSQLVIVTGLSPITVALNELAIPMTLEEDPVASDTVNFFGCFSGNCMTLLVPELIEVGNNSAGLITYTGLPELYWPRVDHQLTSIAVLDNGIFLESGTLTLSTTGTVTLGASNAMTTGFIDPVDFVASLNNVGHQGIYITYLVA